MHKANEFALKFQKKFVVLLTCWQSISYMYLNVKLIHGTLDPPVIYKYLPYIYCSVCFIWLYSKWMAVVHVCALWSLIHCIRGNFFFFSQIESNVVVNKSFYLYGLIWDFIFTKSQYKWEKGKYTKRFSINNIILCILFFILFSLSCMSRTLFFFGFEVSA